MCSLVYNGKPVGTHEWWEKNWAADSSFHVGPITLSKEEVVGTHIAILKSFPDLQFNVIEPLATQGDGTISLVLEATGTHTGEPYAFAPHVEPIATTGVKCVNDHERVTITFNTEGMIVKQVIETLPGGRGFSGPPGFYQQLSAASTPA